MYKKKYMYIYIYIIFYRNVRFMGCNFWLFLNWFKDFVDIIECEREFYSVIVLKKKIVFVEICMCIECLKVKRMSIMWDGEFDELDIDFGL